MDFYTAVNTIFEPKGSPKVLRMHIAGEWVRGHGFGEESLVRNPATEEVLARVHDADVVQTKTVFEAARISQEYWRNEVPMQDKEKVFQRIASYLEEYRGQLSWVIIKEGGKLWRWAETEVQETIDTVWHYHGEISRIYGQYSECQMRDKVAIAIREPYGVILGITPWNFPLAVPSWKIFAALAGGNAIIVKAAEQTPTTASLLCYLVNEAIKQKLGAAQAEKLNGLFQVIHGRGETVGKMLVEEGDYDKVMFTGGTFTGGLVGELAGKRRKPVSLELGGHAAIILMNDFDLDRASTEALNGAFGDSGQRCVSTRTVFAEESIAHAFVDMCNEKMRKLRIGNPADLETQIGPLISQEQLDRVQEQVERSRKDGVDSIRGGFIIKKSPLHFHSERNISPSAFEKGYYMHPALIEVPPSDIENCCIQNEIFGPVLSVMPFSGKHPEEALMNAISLMNSSKYGLSNAVMTNKHDLAMKAVKRCKSGILYIGRGTTGAEVGQYFGGIKNSGHGREGKGLEEVTCVKQVYIDYHGKPRMAQAGADDTVKQILQDSQEEGKLVF